MLLRFSRLVISKGGDLLLRLFLFLALPLSTSAQKTNYSYASRMWYTNPAINWNEALPIGNGRMGAMVFGGVKTERLQLNEQTLWSGAPRNWNNPKAKVVLPLVRKAALEGKYKLADSLSKQMQGPYTESYMPMADLLIRYQNISDSSAYTRDLNMDSALTKTQFTDGAKTYNRTAFASFPDRVIVYRNSCNARGSISFKAELTSKLHYKIYRLTANHIVLKGKCPKHVEPVYVWKVKDDKAIQYAEDERGEGMNFEVDLLVKNEGGRVSADDKYITVENADAVSLIISAATSYNGFTKSPGLQGKNPAIAARRSLNAAAKKTFHQLKQRHINDYQPIFRRFQLNLGEGKNLRFPTDERLKLMSVYNDPEIVASVAQFGRYILIAGSRPGGLPVNLKGIWNDRVRPEYSSNWCIDHDAQMFYYAVETTNLSEMHEPFLDFINDLSKNGRITAAVNYGMRGWCAHHNTDIWRQTGPVGNYGDGNPHWATWNMSGPWLCANLFDHYQFTGDKRFLREKAWPAMKGAAQFCLDWLVKNKDGKLISAPSVSPENTFITGKGDTAEISISTTSDIALMRELFTNCIKTSAILNIDKALSIKLQKTLAQLMPYQVGLKGELREWFKPWRPVDRSHRHLSHLYPIFPGNEISPGLMPKLADAAKKALSLRTKTNCTWGFPLKAACWARLGEADSAWTTWQNQLRYVDPRSKSSKDNYGLFPNFFNSDGADLIMNGNGCATAVIAEMLVQSRPAELELLPALPKVFVNGSASGICARGGFVINLYWDNSALKNAVILSKLGNTCRLRSKSAVEIYCGIKKVRIKKTGSDLYCFKTEKGLRYSVRTIQ